MMVAFSVHVMLHQKNAITPRCCMWEQQSPAQGSHAMNTLVKGNTRILKSGVSIKTKLLMFGLCSGLLSSTRGFGVRKRTENIGEAAARNRRYNSATTIRVSFVYTLRIAFMVASFCMYGCSYPCPFPSTTGWGWWREDVLAAWAAGHCLRAGFLCAVIVSTSNVSPK